MNKISILALQENADAKLVCIEAICHIILKNFLF